MTDFTFCFKSKVSLNSNRLKSVVDCDNEANIVRDTRDRKCQSSHIISHIKAQKCRLIVKSLAVRTILNHGSNCDVYL